jgi:uncharacterized protein (DUF1499 family)
MPLLRYAGKRPKALGVRDTRLAPCPSSPNCVSSDAADPLHAVPLLELIAPPQEAWRAVHELVQALPRTRIVTENENYLHAECRSALIGFVDDLEFHLRPAAEVIAVRSAARIGRRDFGVNRRRVERLRAMLVQRGVVASSSAV